MLHCFSPFFSLLQLPCATSKSKNKMSPIFASPAFASPAVISAPSCSNAVLDDVADAIEEDLPVMPSSNDTSKSKKKRSSAVASPPSVSNTVLADEVHDDKEDLTFIASSNPVSIMLFCFTFILNFVI